MNINQRAIELMEENKYDEALKLFEEAVKVSRNIQSLTNLAWFYFHEENEEDKALELLQDTIKLNPSSHFPYNLLGEIYITHDKWMEAKDILLKAISIHPTKPAYYNLAVAYYHLDFIEEASKYFLLGSTDPSDHALFCQLKCLIELEKSIEAKNILDTFSDEDDEFVGEVEVAELYVELGCYNEALEWFERGWNIYAKKPSWVGRYAYCLLKMNDLSKAPEILNHVIAENAERLKDLNEYDDEDSTEDHKQLCIKELREEQSELTQMYERIASGAIPPMEFHTSDKTDCYLFGCIRHQHPEYEE